MGVYIKGMAMPKNCNECKFGAWSNVHQTVACKGHDFDPCFKDHSREYENNRADFCPLVEVPVPHGRLIDADELETDMINGIRAGNLEEGYERYQNINDVDDCVDCVRYADTVIDEEGGENHDETL